MHYDIIIIGSGSGSGAGGWCHSFNLHGSRFTPGVHYIGLMGEGESSSDLYKGLGIANDLLFFQMNPNGYEYCWIGEERKNENVNKIAN